MILPIVYIGDPILYKKTKKLFNKELENAKVQILINDMTDTINSIPIAAGLAAPQVGRLERLFGIRLGEKSLTYELIKGPKDFKIPANEPFFFINPELSFPTAEKTKKVEACLSIPHYFGEVERFQNVKVKARDRDGNNFELLASKFLSRLIQHEFDHLEGKLWTQRVTDPKTITFSPEKEVD